MARFGSIGKQYFDDDGKPLVDGLLYFYESGTNTLKDTFADVNLSVFNANPVELTAAGRQPNIFFNGTAKIRLTTASGVQIEVRDPDGGDPSSGVFAPWNAITIYNPPDIVTGSDGLFYITITSGNQGNDPTLDAVNWTQIRFIRVWNANETYSINMVAQGSDGLLYTSQVNNNTNNDPTGDEINWKNSVAIEVQAVIRAAAKTFASRNF